MERGSRDKAHSASLVYRHKKHEDNRYERDKEKLLPLPKADKVLPDGARVWSFN